MADAYGMITFAKSEDCIFDLVKMKDLLNEYEWDNSGAKWVCSNSGTLYIDGYYFDRPQYPTAIPKEVQFYCLFAENGSFINRRPDDMSEDDWDNLAGRESIPIPLNKLTARTCSLIQSGWIEIACVGNEKGRYVYFESLRIYADGTASRKRINSGPMTVPEEIFEEYVPEKIAA